MFGIKEEELSDWETLVVMSEASALQFVSVKKSASYLSDESSRRRERELNIRFLTEIFEEVG